MMHISRFAIVSRFIAHKTRRHVQPIVQVKSVFTVMGRETCQLIEREKGMRQYQQLDKKERQTDRQRQRETKTEIERSRDRDRNRQRDRVRQRDTDREIREREGRVGRKTLDLPFQPTSFPSSHSPLSNVYTQCRQDTLPYASPSVSSLS